VTRGRRDRRPGDQTAREAIAATVLVGAGSALWGLLTFASGVAGGRPTANIVSFLDLETPAQAIQSDFQHGRGLVLWHLVGAYGPLNSWMFWFAGVGALLGIALALICGTFALRGGVPMLNYLGHYRTPKLARTSEWATRRELRRVVNTSRDREGCWLLGYRGNRPVWSRWRTNVLVVGATGSGKTARWVVANGFAWQGPLVVTSTKAELVKILASHRQRIGPVWIYDPTADIRDEYPGVTWSPLSGCQDINYALRMGEWLASGMADGEGRSEQDWNHWRQAAKRLCGAMLFIAASAGEDINTVSQWIDMSDLETPYQLLGRGISSDQESLAMAARLLSSIETRAEREKASCFSTCQAIFGVFLEKAVADSAATSQFDPAELLNRKGTLFLVSPAEQPKRVAPLFVGIVQSIINEATLMSKRLPGERLRDSLGLLLDELPTFCPIDDLDQLVSQCAGKGIELFAITQDLAQLRAKYGPNRSNTIVNNCPAKLVLPGLSDPDSLEYLSKLLGRTERVEVSLSTSNQGSSRSYTGRPEELATPDAISGLQDGTAILHYRGVKTMVRMPYWRDVPHYARRAALTFFPNIAHLTGD